MNEEIHHKINPSPSSAISFFLLFFDVAGDVSRISVARRSDKNLFFHRLGIDTIQKFIEQHFFLGCTNSKYSLRWIFRFPLLNEENKTPFIQWTRAHWLIRTTDLFNLNVGFKEGKKKGGKRYAFIQKTNPHHTFFFSISFFCSTPV